MACDKQKYCCIIIIISSNIILSILLWCDTRPYEWDTLRVVVVVVVVVMHNILLYLVYLTCFIWPKNREKKKLWNNETKYTTIHTIACQLGLE